MSSDDTDLVLDVCDASKRFCRRLGRSLRYGAADIARELVGLTPPAALRRDEFWAVDGVSFKLRRGECLGLIGANGAGKSSLLKMIAGLIKPDRGGITVRGRVGALIELGAGMHPLLSGRENIRLNAAILGLSRREIAARMDQIIEFAGIGEFIDAPVQSYSSGMRVRLGFAVAAHLEPELLLIDEVFAVGDLAFQQRCSNFLRSELPNTAKIFVSHDLGAMSALCERICVLNAGKVSSCSAPPEAIASYLSLMQGRMERTDSGADLKAHQPGFVSGKGDFVIQAIDVSINGGSTNGLVRADDTVSIRVLFEARAATSQLIVGFLVVDRFGNALFGGNNAAQGRVVVVPGPGTYAARWCFSWPAVRGNDYALTVGLGEGPSVDLQIVQCWWQHCFTFRAQALERDACLLRVPQREFHLTVESPL